MDKLLSLLGLAKRAGRLEAGFDACAGAARAKRAALLIAAKDVSEKTFKNLRYEDKGFAGAVLSALPKETEDKEEDSI